MTNSKPTEEMTPEEISALSSREKAIRGLEYSPEIYNAEWYQMQSWQHPWCQKLMAWLAGEFGPFESSLDLGAGDGYYSYVLTEMETEAIAVELSRDATYIMDKAVKGIIADLRYPLDLDRKFDLVLCLEVAEHLPEEAAGTLCDTIARHCERLLVFTSAPPGQGGHGHINLQEPKYWQDKLEARGLELWTEASQKTRQAWKNILRDNLPWLSKNALIYKVKDN